MRIFKALEFLSLPEGVIFARGEKWDFSTLEVKGETIVIGDSPRGYWSRSLSWIEGDGTTGDERDDFNRLEAMYSSGASFPINDAYSKTLPVEDDTVFLVLEDLDLAELSSLALGAMSNLPPR